MFATNHIILASHSNLAQGMYDSLRFFNHDIQNVDVICAYEDGLNFEEVLIEKIEGAKDKNIIIITDILGGSVNQTAVKLTRIYPLQIIAGMNLPVVISLAFEREDADRKRLIDILEEAKAQIIYVNDLF